MIVDFRRDEVPPPPLSINGSIVEQITSFKFLGTHVSNSMTWDTHCNQLLKKARQRMYFLSKVNSFNVKKETLVNFYRAVIESVLTQSITVWYTRAPKKNLQKLTSIIKKAEKIIGRSLPSLEKIYKHRTTNKSKKIMKDKTHPANKLFEFLPSGYRLKAFKGNKRLVNSLYPSAVKLFNRNAGRKGHRSQLADNLS